MNAPHDPTPTINWLRQQREELDRTIQYLEKQAPPPPHSPQVSEGRVKIEIVSAVPQSQKESPTVRVKPGQFEGMRIWEAAKTLLVMVKAPQSTSQIAACLIRGGVESKAQRLETNLYTVMKNKPTVFRKVGPGLWDLTKDLGQDC